MLWMVWKEAEVQASKDTLWAWERDLFVDICGKKKWTEKAKQEEGRAKEGLGRAPL